MLRRSNGGEPSLDPGVGKAVRLKWYPMRKLLMVGLGLCVFGALWKAEEEEDGMAVAMSPFLAALAIEAGIFLLRRHQGSLLGQTYNRSRI